MNLYEALNDTGVAETVVNGLVYVVKDDQADYSPSEPDGEPNDPNDYVLTIADGGMPPHFTKSYASLEEIIAEHGEMEWSAIEMEY
jgi:hypothetical protein